MASNFRFITFSSPLVYVSAGGRHTNIAATRYPAIFLKLKNHFYNYKYYTRLTRLFQFICSFFEKTLQINDSLLTFSRKFSRHENFSLAGAGRLQMLKDIYFYVIIFYEDFVIDLYQEGFFMATSSIEHNFVVSSPESVKMFADSLDDAFRESEERKASGYTLPDINLVTDQKEIDAIFTRYFEGKKLLAKKQHRF
ncbi:MAG: hypothetical protein Q4C56_02000 [Peptococcaceae bacterium]|nr:hypothetical protein [Peptococcaceae bacterium]